MFREKEPQTKSKSETPNHDLGTALPEGNGITKPANVLEKTPVAASRVIALTPVAPREYVDSKNEVGPELKRLIVGRGISLKGKISSCDRLVIEGDVEAELENCHTIEVAQTGRFKGTAEIVGAEISGHYEGSLTVRDNLLIRATGRVSGTMRYGRLHIEDGGEIDGDVKSMGAPTSKVL